MSLANRLNKGLGRRRIICNSSIVLLLWIKCFLELLPENSLFEPNLLNPKRLHKCWGFLVYRRPSRMQLQRLPHIHLLLRTFILSLSHGPKSRHTDCLPVPKYTQHTPPGLCTCCSHCLNTPFPFSTNQDLLVLQGLCQIRFLLWNLFWFLIWN